MKKYSFKFNCECNSPSYVIHPSFTADYFLDSRSPYLDLISESIWWEIDEGGKARIQLGDMSWPRELSFQHFARLAQAYARKVLRGEKKFWCDCGTPLLIAKDGKISRVRIAKKSSGNH